MKSMKIEFSGVEGSMVNLVLDGQKMTVAEGTASRQVGAGRHELHWHVIAPPGSKYSLAVTAPKEAEAFKLKDQKMTQRGWNAGLWKPEVK